MICIYRSILEATVWMWSEWSGLNYAVELWMKKRNIWKKGPATQVTWSPTLVVQSLPQTHSHRSFLPKPHGTHSRWWILLVALCELTVAERSCGNLPVCEASGTVHWLEFHINIPGVNSKLWNCSGQFHDLKKNLIFLNNWGMKLKNNF
jgi:hypothetical protein